MLRFSKKFWPNHFSYRIIVGCRLGRDICLKMYARGWLGGFCRRRSLGKDVSLQKKEFFCKVFCNYLEMEGITGLPDYFTTSHEIAGSNHFGDDLVEGSGQKIDFFMTYYQRRQETQGGVAGKICQDPRCKKAVDHFSSLVDVSLGED